MEFREVASGAWAYLQEDRGWGWSNTGFIAGGGGLVVDTLMDVGHTRSMLERVAEVAPGRPRRLVNTHHNIDHCWGNQLLKDAEIIGHRACAERMRGDLTPEALQALVRQADLPPGLRWFVDDMADFDFSDVEVTPPTTLIDGDRVLDLDGQEAHLLYVGPAHTEGDLIVHLPASGVLFAGDVVFHRCTPIGWEGTFAGWIAALERILALEPAVVVPGHGPLCKAEGVRGLRDYLQYVYDESCAFHEQGLSAMEAARKIDLGPYAGWTQPERLLFNVERAYRELRGGAWDEPVEVMRLLQDAYALGRFQRGEA